VARDLATWGGNRPSDQMRAIGSAPALARLDPDLTAALDAATSDERRRVARWVIRRVLTEAGLADVAWIAAALGAMDRGAPLPWPLDDPRDDTRAWQALRRDATVPHTTVRSLNGELDNMHQQSMAFPALLAARLDDPLTAVVKALWAGAATFGYGRERELFDEVRREFPELGRDN
jgi:hypothetical protein